MSYIDNRNNPDPFYKDRREMRMEGLIDGQRVVLKFIHVHGGEDYCRGEIGGVRSSQN